MDYDIAYTNQTKTCKLYEYKILNKTYLFDKQSSRAISAYIQNSNIQNKLIKLMLKNNYPDVIPSVRKVNTIITEDIGINYAIIDAKINIVDTKQNIVTTISNDDRYDVLRDYEARSRFNNIVNVPNTKSFQYNNDKYILQQEYISNFLKHPFYQYDILNKTYSEIESIYYAKNSTETSYILKHLIDSISSDLENELFEKYAYEIIEKSEFPESINRSIINGSLEHTNILYDEKQNVYISDWSNYQENGYVIYDVFYPFFSHCISTKNPYWLISMYEDVGKGNKIKTKLSSQIGNMSWNSNSFYNGLIFLFLLLLIENKPNESQEWMYARDICTILFERNVKI